MRFKFLTNWIKKIKESDNQYLYDTIEELGYQIDDLKKDIDSYEDSILELNAELLTKENELLMVTYQLENLLLESKLKSEEEYFRNVIQYHKWDGKVNRAMHYSLENFSKDIDTQLEYSNFLMNLNIGRFKTPDSCIYGTTKKVLEWIDGKYKKDRIEQWNTPKESLNKYLHNEVGDCDDVRALLWGALVTSMIRSGFKDELWRLKCANIGIIGSTGHAVLFWIKDNGVFSLIETTYVPENFEYIWKWDKDIRNSCYIRITAIFDEVSEYKLL